MASGAGEAGNRGASLAGSERPAPERVQLAHQCSIRIGPVTIDPPARTIAHDDGREECVEPRVMEVLVALVRAEGTILTRDDLIDCCWDGRIVGDEAISSVIYRLRRAAKNIADGVFRIETVSKVGFRLVRDDNSAARHAIAGAGHAAAGAPIWAGRLRMVVAALAATGLLSGGPTGSSLLLTTSPTSAEAMPAIAVLPFRNLSPGDDYFAEGVAEEILDRLAREPQMRVAGRTSSFQFGGEADPREVGRRLGVSWLIEGSVRQANGRVRINVALLDTSDGMRRWSQAYEGRLDDIFAIQDRIGEGVAANLSRRLVRPGPRTTSGGVYALYLTARGLIRDREAAKIDAAAALLRRAVQLDPNYAPAWASLGQATLTQGVPFGGPPADPTARSIALREALGHVRRALAIDPNLAQAYSVMAVIVANAGGNPIPHAERAVRLDPRDAENRFRLSQSYGTDGQFERSLAEARQAVAIEPLWFLPVWWNSVMAGDMGYPTEVERIQRRFGANSLPQPFEGHMAQAMIFAFRNDYSGAVLANRAASEVAPDGRRRFALNGITRNLSMLGYHDEAVRLDPTLAEIGALRSGSLPSSSAVQERLNREWPGLSSYSRLLVNQLLKSGRARDLLRFYDRRWGSPEAMTRGVIWRLHFVEYAPLFALALRRAGRHGEADRLLALANDRLRPPLRAGRVTRQYLVGCAVVWELQGHRDAALSALEAAVRRGWIYGGTNAYPDIAQEPLIESLQGDPRFERLRARMNAHIERERRELGSAHGLIAP